MAFRICFFTLFAVLSFCIQSEAGFMHDLDSAFGSFAKLPMIWTRRTHSQSAFAPRKGDFPAIRVPSNAEDDDQSILIAKRIDNEIEELPSPMKLQKKEEVKGYTRDDGTYIVEDTTGMPCVMAYFKARITVYYPINKKQEKYDSRTVSPPDDVDVTGTCDRDALVAILNLVWEKGTFSLRFAFDDFTDSWFVEQFKFTFDTSNYRGSEKDENVVIVSDENRRYWQTTHAKSFRCLLLHDVALMDTKQDSYSGTIHFNEARVQALSKTKTFKRPKHCIHRVRRSEMVPITVGGTLFALTGLTVVGYAAFRYFKVKKFDYGTME